VIKLQDFVGNEDLIKVLRISIIAAKERNDVLPHILLRGPAGTGKTTLAEAIAAEFGCVPLTLTPATAKKAEDLRKLFLKMPSDGYSDQGKVVGKIQPQIIFVDEVHQLPLLAQENLGIAMQDWRLAVRVNGRDAFEWVPRFTLIGATTMPGKLSKPFLDRFKIQANLDTYKLEEAVEITLFHAKARNLELEEGVALAIARRSRGVARLIVRFLDRVADAAVVVSQGTEADKNKISLEVAELMLSEFLKVDKRGLTPSDIKILIHLSMLDKPVGIDALAAISNEDKQSVERTIEPYLIQEGLLTRTTRGRLITDEGRKYLAVEGHTTAQPGLARARVIGAQE